MSESLSSRLEPARLALEQGQNILNRALSHVKRQCLGDSGRVAASRIDEHQLIAYDLALSYAELVGSRTLLNYADRVRQRQESTADPSENLLLEERFALHFCADSIQTIRGRLAPRKAEMGLTAEDFAKAFDGKEVEAFCSEMLSTARWVELGGMVLQHQGRLATDELEEDKQIMRETFQNFASQVVMPLAETIHREDRIIPDEILQPLVDMGCFGLSIPEQYGGLQPDDCDDNLGMIVVTEELSRGSLAAAGSLITRPEILSRALLAGGTKEQKQYWLPRLAQGQPLCAVAITEPDYGSDVAGMKLKAERVEGGWRLNGAKTWCTFGGKAGVLLTLARTDPDASLGHRGLSMFLVEKPPFDGHRFEYRQDEGGVITGEAIDTIGYRGMHSFAIFFDDYFVPDANLLGGEAGLGKGFYYTMAGFAGGRIQTAARATGLMQAAYDRAVSYARARKVFGMPVGEYPLTLVKLARMATLLTAARQFTYEVGRLMDAGSGQMEASLVKLFACRSSEWLCREAMQIHGGMGYAEESDVSRYWIDSRVLSIFEGAEETLALKVIARNLVENAT